MAPDTEAETQPLFQPRVIRFLKDRPKLVGGGLREDFWEEVENNVAERRKPDTAAERLVQNIMERVAESSAPVARKRIRDRFVNANEGLLENL